MPLPPKLLSQLQNALTLRNVLSAAPDLSMYEYDGGVDRYAPEAVVFPKSTDDVVSIVKLANEYKTPIVGRGAGTGLSGGSIPRAGGLLVSFARMNRILEIDIPNERATVEPGVVNLDLTEAVQPYGYFFAPDPSSQRACTIGGNVAENAGGPHTLAYGVTTNHVTGLQAVLADGSVLELGGKDQDVPGYDLAGVLNGSEGTLCLITRITVRLMRKPEAVRTMLAIFQSAEAAGRTVGEITARQLLPVALEMLDGPMIRMVEEATHAGYPPDAAAVLLIETEGLLEAVEWQTEAIAQVCRDCGAGSVRIAQDEEERALLWKGRKNAFGAIGRVSPTYYVQDGVVPRTKIAQTLEAIARIGLKYGKTVSNIFHAGDGNLHPIILFDARKPGDLRAAQLCGEEILAYCLSVGGSITGEHGVGMEKMELMTQQFSPDALDLVQRLKAVFDPHCSLNPGKILPAARSCREIHQTPETVTRY